MKRSMIDASQLELTEKVVTIKRVTKVVKGGRNMRFTALVVVGDQNGHVGVGLGKATEIPEAIRKGKEDAAKNLITVALDEVGSITHDYTGKYGSANVLLKKSPDGTGIIAAARHVPSVRWQGSRTSVRSPSAPTTSRMLSWLRSTALAS